MTILPIEHKSIKAQTQKYSIKKEQNRTHEKTQKKHICDAFLLNEAYVADSKVEQQAFICVKGVVW